MDKIKYIGATSPWRDDLTGSGLTWTTGQEANVADHVGNVARGYTSHFQMVDDGVKVTADSSGTLYRDDTQSPVSGEGGMSATAKLLASNTGAQNMALIQAAHDSLIGKGGTILLPAGRFSLDGNLSITAGGPDLFGSSVTIRGQGMGATILDCLRQDGATFTKTSGHAHAFRDLTLIGPGVAYTESVGMNWLNAAGGGLWENLWIQGFGCGSQFWDATSMTFSNCHWHGNAVNKRLGFNCDLFQYYGGRIQNAPRGIHVGWRGPSNQAGGMKCSPVTLHGVRFGDCSSEAIFIDDVEGFGIAVDGGYFEYNGCSVKIGGNGTNSGAKNVKLTRCDFTRPISAADVQIKCTEVNTDAILVVEDSHADYDCTGNFAEVGFQSSITWARNQIGVTGAGKTIKVGDTSISSGWTIIIPRRATWEYNRNHHLVGDGTLLGNTEPLRKAGMTNGTGKVLERFTRYSGATLAEVGLMASEIKDVDGKFVLFEGPVRPGAIALASLPTASATYRGITVRVESASGVADGLYTCLKSAADTYSWKQVVAG